jgi:signal peptidase
MTGELNVGDVAIYESYDKQPLVEGQVIVFEQGSSMIVHRVVDIEIINGYTRYYTKGDANDTEDAGMVHSSELVGTPVAVIPQLGYFASYIQSESGKRTALVVGGALILFVFVTDSFTNDKKKKAPKKDEPET